MLGPVEIWTAFSIGLLGSIHCLGMCGPLAMVMPFQGTGRGAIWRGVLIYNLGRLFSYSFIGAIAGILGRGLWIAGVQKHITLALGITLIIIDLFSISVESRLLRLPAIRHFHQWVLMRLSNWMRRDGAKAALMIGILNGFLPCGLVYMAIAGALTGGSIPSGALFMAIFGLGTFPLMAISGIAGQAIDLSWRYRLRRLAPFLLLLIAALFIFRGLQFQIPNQFRFLEEARNIPMCY